MQVSFPNPKPILHKETESFTPLDSVSTKKEQVLSPLDLFFTDFLQKKDSDSFTLSIRVFFLF